MEYENLVFVVFGIDRLPPSVFKVNVGAADPTNFFAMLSTSPTRCDCDRASLAMTAVSRSKGVEAASFSSLSAAANASCSWSAVSSGFISFSGRFISC